MEFQFNNHGDVFACVRALRAAANHYEEAAEEMRESGDAGFVTLEKPLLKMAATARRIADQIEQRGKETV